jgi:ABC-type nitrate/sulfonate/bicarbonate transport system permease component
LARALVAFATATLLGVPLGLAMGLSAGLSAPCSVPSCSSCSYRSNSL